MVLYLVVLDLIADKLTFKALLELFSAGYVSYSIYNAKALLSKCNSSVKSTMHMDQKSYKFLKEQFHTCCVIKHVNISLLLDPFPKKLELFG